MKNDIFCVITSIQEPTDSVIRLRNQIGEYHGTLIVIGDRKGPDTFSLEGGLLYTLEQQKNLDFHLAAHIPENHYARKNLGYLIAMQNGASCIYETDDDNAPAENWKPRQLKKSAVVCPSQKWVNIYQYFSNAQIWPRGFPLEFIQEKPVACNPLLLTEEDFPVQQGLVNGSPDVDAIWRLLFDQKAFWFNEGFDVCLRKNSWCPFNSQNTWWWTPAYPLMYLPSYCSFRMTDIWRSFIAQRCLWDEGYGMLFFAADVIQERNYHNLKKDFESEIPGYLRNEGLCDLLQNIDLSSSERMSDKVLSCYEILVANDFFPPEELTLVHAWIHDIKRISGESYV